MSGVLTAVIGLALKHTLGWRITDDDETAGIDQAEHAESGYDLGGFAVGAGRGLAIPRSTVPSAAAEPAAQTEMAEKVEGANA